MTRRKPNNPNKDEVYQEAQDSGVKRVAAKQPFSDTKKKITFQEDSSFDYADIQKNVLALRKHQEMLETIMKTLIKHNCAIVS